MHLIGDYNFFLSLECRTKKAKTLLPLLSNGLLKTVWGFCKIFLFHSLFIAFCIEYLKNVVIENRFNKIVAERKGVTPADGLTGFVNVPG